MSFATSPKQQPTAAIPPTTTTTKSSVSSTSANTTAQNSLSSLRLQQLTPHNQTLMIKNIETSSNIHTTDGDENEEEEKEICNVLQRRDSVPEDATVTTATKLNTIQESIENNNDSFYSSCSSPPPTSSLQIQQQRHEAQSTPILAPADTTTDSAIAEEEQNQTNSSYEVLNWSSIANSSNQSTDQDKDSTTLETEATQAITTSTTAEKPNKTPSPSDSPRSKSSTSLKGKLQKTPSFSKISNSSQNSLVVTYSSGRVDEDTVSKSSDTSGELGRNTSLQESASVEKVKCASRLSGRAKKKSWYNVLYPNYKSRSQDFKKLFKEVPSDERLIVDYSCALQREILVQGRLYVSQNYVCFHANIFRWETYLSIKWKDVTSISKEKTALVIPNAISICTAKEKFFFATFTTRDKAFLMLFRVWQNTLMNKQMLPQEMWQWVHNCYGDELGLTTDDEDYIDPTSVPDDTEGDLDFVSALDDLQSQSSLAAASDYSTANSNSNLSINQVGQSNNQNNNHNNSNNINNNSGSSSISSGSVGPGASKSKTKSYFSNSNKASSSTNTSAASGSDNKASDNNSGADCKTNKEMKPNAKELTLMSAKPDEGSGGGGGGGGVAASAASVNGSASGGGGGGAGTAIASSSTPSKDSKAGATSYDGKRKVSKNSRQRDESLNKNSEALPTDMSDSSDSDENKIPFVATAECTSTHEGRQLVHTILPINIETLFNLLFSKSKFLVDFHAMRKSTDTNFPEWVTDEEGHQTRTVNVTVQLAASVGPKTSKVTEYQVMREGSKAGELYSIDINSVNAGIPYADSFSVLMHYCLVKTVDDHTMLSVHAQIKYKKSIWGVVKGFIEKNTWAGLEDFYTSLLHALQSETCIPPAKGKGRRPRRGTAAQIRPLEESPQTAQTKPEPAENVLATLTPHLPVAGQFVAAESKNKYKWLSLFVLVLLGFLIVLNVILLLKLWKLEDRIEDDLSNRARMPNLSSLKQLPNTHQDWIELLRQQEILHETELKKWHHVLQTAIELLKKCPMFNPTEQRPQTCY